MFLSNAYKFENEESVTQILVFNSYNHYKKFLVLNEIKENTSNEKELSYLRYTSESGGNPVNKNSLIYILFKINIIKLNNKFECCIRNRNGVIKSGNCIFYCESELDGIIRALNIISLLNKKSF